MMSIGPLPIKTAGVFAAILLSWLVTRAVAKRMPDVSHKLTGAVLLDGVFWGVIAARLGYVVQWWDEYFAAPMAIFSIGDGGYTWWVGVLATLLFVRWRTRTIQVPRRPIYVGVLTGVLAWLGAGALFGLLHQAPSLPEVQLAALDGQPVSLGSYQGGPVVVNLWASWCPPCRREMPVFERAQGEFSDIAFVMVNQGESAQQAKEFLVNENLNLTDVLLDPSSRLMQTMGSSALPTTLFFDADGKLVDSHLGEITMPSLKDTLSRRFNESLRPEIDQ